jgi:hypothetical protein
MQGDATAAYAPGLGLQQFSRHLVFLKPDVLISADEIRTERDSELELRFHPEADLVAHGSAFLSRGPRAALRIEPLTTDGTQLNAGPWPPAVPKEHGEMTMTTLRLMARRHSWRNVVAFSWSPAGSEPAPVTLNRDHDRLTFRCGPRELILNWTTSRVE